MKRLLAALVFCCATLSAAPAVVRALPFDPADVRLLDGPFRRAMERDAEYLLKLEPDRLLSWFRKESGLPPKGEVYGGWEKQGIAGHSLGHYLSAVSYMYAATGDRRFRERAEYIVSELQACQNANGNGYVAALPNGKRVFAEVAKGDIRSKGFDLNGSWVPWYTLHKQFAGLLDAHRLTGNAAALQVAVKLADWAERTTSGLNDEQWQRMLACEHGGMNEVLAELYARTGDRRYLALSRKFHHRAVLDPLTRGEDKLAGLHANTQIPKLIGLARRYEIDGSPDDRRAAEFFWERITGHHSYVIGGNSFSEYLGQPDKLNDRLGTNTAETCNTYNVLKLTRHLFGWQPDARYADYYERALVNHILASQNPRTGMMCYYVPLRSGDRKAYSDPFDSFWCCVGTGMENHAKYNDSIYFHDDRSLWVNLFIASELKWTQKGLTLRQETSYPESGTSRLLVTAAKPVELSLLIRYPRWAERGMRVAVNGKGVEHAAAPGSYVTITRRWKTGDRIDLEMPMTLHLEPMPDNPNRVAVLYGPNVLAGDLGPEDDPAARSPLYAPAILPGNRKVNEWVEGDAGTFRTVKAGTPRDVAMLPFYRMHERRYAVYWDLFTPEQWEQRKAEYEAEQERIRRLEAATVDVVELGEMQPEREHNMQGEQTSAGEAFGRKWRHATGGGWFSVELKVLSDAPVSLVCTYWGGDGGNRTFDILADGVRIASESLRQKKPGQFVDVTYEIPPELTRGKTKITVRFAAQPNQIAGGVFAARIVRK